MVFIDIHTHNIAADHETAILNSLPAIMGRKISIGIHPWDIGDKWMEPFAAIQQAAIREEVAAIGECGFDTLKSPATPEVQERVFRAHAELAEQAGKPLIIHCVKAYDKLIALRKETDPAQPWIIHGFRGKAQLAMQLAKAGFYISLGEHFNPDSAKAIPVEKLFIESDESTQPIAGIYAAVARAIGITAGQLAAQVAANARIFGQF